MKPAKRDFIRRPSAALAPALILAFLAVLAFTPIPAQAAQTRVFEETFGSAAQPTFSGTTDIAVDQSTGDVLVIEGLADRIARYHADGTPSNFSALATNVIDGAGPGADQTPQNGLAFTISSYTQIAIDNSGTATDGDIYVAQNIGGGASVRVIDVFASSGEYLGQLTGGGGHTFGEGAAFGGTVSPCGVTVGSDGDVYVGGWTDEKIYKYDPAANPPTNGDLAATFDVEGGGEGGEGGLDWPCHLATGASPTTGSLFVEDYRGEGEVYKLDASSGAIDYRVYSGISGGQADDTAHIAVDPTNGDVLVATSGEGIHEFDASGASKAVPVTSPFGGGSYVAAAPSGRLYLSEGSQLAVWSTLVALPDPITGKAGPVGELTVTLGGTVETHGIELTECAFEYVEAAAYEPGASNPYAAGETVPCAESPAQIGTGTAQVHADLSGLSPETAYHFRLTAANEFGFASPQGKDQTFQTVSKPGILAAFSQDVALHEATLKAEINPQSAAATYRFEWGLVAASYEHSTADIAIGSDPTPHTVSLLLSGLTPGAAYHYRVLAENHCHPETSPATICTTTGPERRFTTFLPFSPQTGCPNQVLRSGPAAALPDCRAYEMVSPVDKGGGDVVREAQNFVSGAYVQARPDGDALTYTATAAYPGAPTNVRLNQYLASRGAGGWSNQGISAPVSGQGPSVSFGFLSYFRAFTADLCSAWLFNEQTPPLTADAQEGFENLYRRDNCDPGAGGFEALTTSEPQPAGAVAQNYVNEDSIEGIAADGSHAVFKAGAKLTPEAILSGQGSQLYERSGGALHLVSVLPGGAPVLGNSQAGDGGTFGNRATAVSADGERVYWTNDSHLYLRIHPEQGVVAKECNSAKKACTVPVSAGPGADFWAASPDGSRALYTEGGTLYEFDLARYEAEPSEASLPIAAGVIGLAGQSIDLTRVYFVSTEALPGAGQNSEEDEAQSGRPNLYLWKAGAEPAFSFIATLAAVDIAEEAGVGAQAYSVADAAPKNRATRVSPDGLTIAFNSRAPLTGYDNTDTASGKPVVEVYRYEADGALACISCNPGGGRPASRKLLEPYEAPWQNEVRPEARAAAWIPNWEHPLQASNVLSSDGNRIFFNANDALLPRDTNGAPDVYEWEAAGTGGCDTGDADYFARNGGCLYLISSGESSYESEFWEASPDGSDVFFTTAQSLVAKDPGSVDLYDARVDGGFAEPTAAAACEGEACQSPPGAPSAAAPASAAFQGPGNLPGPSRCARPARQAKELSGRAGRLRRQARHAAEHGNPRGARRMQRKARRLAHRAHGLSRSAKRCRSRARKRASTDRRAHR